MAWDNLDHRLHVVLGIKRDGELILKAKFESKDLSIAFTSMEFFMSEEVQKLDKETAIKKNDGYFR